MQQLSFGLLLFAFVFLNAQCGRDDCEVVPGGRKYYAWAPVSYDPIQEKFKIGDSISIVLSIPYELIDTITKEIIDIKSVVFSEVEGDVIRFVKTSNDSTGWVYAANEFGYSIEKGNFTIVDGTFSYIKIKDFSIDAERGRYVMFKMVPQRTGIYRLRFSTPFINVSGLVGPYCAASLNLYFGDSTSINYHLLNEFDITKVGTYQDNRGSFTFIVEE
jgi:hypothetical protein